MDVLYVVDELVWKCRMERMVVVATEDHLQGHAGVLSTQMIDVMSVVTGGTMQEIVIDIEEVVAGIYI